jgi:hypothetical protein
MSPAVPNSGACSQEEVPRAETCARAATICLQDRGPRSHTPPLAFLGTLSRKNPKKYSGSDDCQDSLAS